MEDSVLVSTPLFRGNTPKEIEKMLDCLQGEQKCFRKGDIIYHAGDTISAMGLVLSGSVHIENNDVWGNKSIFDHVGAGQVFAETYACLPKEPLMVSVVAVEPTEILFLNPNRMLKTCSYGCSYHHILIQNLLTICAQKNLHLSHRIFHTSPKSIRGRLLSYLSYQASKQDSLDFIIPFNRQQLADYLNVDRSAMSNELSKMQKDGLITVYRNHFHLNETCNLS